MILVSRKESKRASTEPRQRQIGHFHSCSCYYEAVFDAAYMRFSLSPSPSLSLYPPFLPPSSLFDQIQTKAKTNQSGGQRAGAAHIAELHCGVVWQAAEDCDLGNKGGGSTPCKKKKKKKSKGFGTSSHLDTNTVLHVATCFVSDLSTCRCQEFIQLLVIVPLTPGICFLPFHML